MRFAVIRAIIYSAHDTQDITLYTLRPFEKLNEISANRIRVIFNLEKYARLLYS